MADIHIYPDDKARSLLEGAKRAFAEKGFDGASMQDLARAASMSAGNFYRYFPSKKAIVEALVAQDLDSIMLDFKEISATGDPAEGLYLAMKRRIEDLQCDTKPLWSEIEAAAQRSPEIAEIVQRIERDVCFLLTAVFARIAGISHEEAIRRHSAEAVYFILVFKGATQILIRPGCLSNPELSAGVRDLILAPVRRIIDGLIPQQT